MEQLLAKSETAQTGIAELRSILNYHQQLNSTSAESRVEVDFTLARGLNYYTGFITEVSTTAVKMGSIGGGGRYDDLTGLFGLKNMSGVGISFGIDRIYDVLEELNLFPSSLKSSTKILLVNMEPLAEQQLYRYLNRLRAEGIAAEFYADAAKFDKQMKYADKRNIPYVGIMGSEELNEQLINVKNMESGTQQKMSLEEVIALLGNA